MSKPLLPLFANHPDDEPAPSPAGDLGKGPGTSIIDMSGTPTERLIRLADATLSARAELNLLVVAELRRRVTTTKNMPTALLVQIAKVTSTPAHHLAAIAELAAESEPQDAPEADPWMREPGRMT